MAFAREYLRCGGSHCDRANDLIAALSRSLQARNRVKVSGRPSGNVAAVVQVRRAIAANHRPREPAAPTAPATDHTRVAVVPANLGWMPYANVVRRDN